MPIEHDEISANHQYKVMFKEPRKKIIKHKHNQASLNNIKQHLET